MKELVDKRLTYVNMIEMHLKDSTKNRKETIFFF